MLCQHFFQPYENVYKTRQYMHLASLQENLTESFQERSIPREGNQSWGWILHNENVSWSSWKSRLVIVKTIHCGSDDKVRAAGSGVKPRNAVESAAIFDKFL